MASSFHIQAREHWTFRLVLLGSRLQLEGCRNPEQPGDEPLHCSTWLQPHDTPYDVAHQLMAHPCCCLSFSDPLQR
jgi:hypothetical protein